LVKKSPFRIKEFYKRMRRSSILAFGLMLMAVFTVSAFAQTVGAQVVPPGKIGLVDTGAFYDDKPGAGIPKLKNAISGVNAKYKTVTDEFNTLTTQYQQKVDEFNKLKNSTAPVADLDARATAIQDLETTIKRKQEDAKSKYDRDMALATDPVNQDIVKALNDYAKQKGYALILDGAKLEQAGILLGFDDKYDVTKDFITFYNSRPASAAGATASTTNPAAAPTKP
jgi:Skp family chaperone for outer membrane proteins